MKTLVHIIPILLSVLVLSGRIDARIINVPEDFETIQAAINESEDGDTVLVQTGEYVENINFEGKAITVASLILTTGDRAYIDSTVIDGNEEDCVVSFNNEEDSTSVLRGFTIRNGIQDFGGGIDCQTETSPTLVDLVVTENVARRGGGGIYFTRNATPIIKRVLISGNSCVIGGGGIGSWLPAHAYLEDVIITDNTSDDLGGGLYGESNGSYTLKNVLIYGNTADHGGGVHFYGSVGNVFNSVTVVGNNAEEGSAGGISLGSGEEGTGGSTCDMVNSIVWGNTETQIFHYKNSESEFPLNISFCDIEGGEEGVRLSGGAELNWLDGNIDEDPLFVDPDEGDYRLMVDSPCIDAGDPDSDPDPDGTRADMGAIPFFHGGVVEIWVLDAEDDSPLEDAIVFTNYGFTAMTDEDGFCRMINVLTDFEFNLTVKVDGYNDSTATGLSVGMDDTLEVIFRLLHPEFNVDPEEISATLMQGESTEINITITNRGNGPLEWTVQPRGPGGFEPWELRQSIDVSEIVNDSRIEGVTFFSNRFYVTGANYSVGMDEPNTIYILNQQGELLNTLPQPDTLNSTYGMRDLAWDGEHIWGSGCRRIAGMNFRGVVEVTFDGPYNTNRALAYDPDRRVLWVSDITYGISGVNIEDGEVVAELDRKGFRIYGLAYWEDDPDGYPLYIFHNPAGDRQHVHKMNPDNGDTMFAADLGSQVEGSAGGAFITDSYDMNNCVFIDIANDAYEDRIDVWQLSDRTSWMEIEPEEGTIEADADQDIDFTIDATDLDVRVYEGTLEFRHNAAGSSVSIPVTLTVTPLSVTDRSGEVPFEFGIVDVYPNPFNSTARLTFTLPKGEHVILRLYDILGREVEELLYEDMCSGKHNVTISAEKLATGVYIARLEGLSNAAFMKLVVIK